MHTVNYHGEKMLWQGICTDILVFHNITGANPVFLVFFKWCMASFKAKASGAFGVKWRLQRILNLNYQSFHHTKKKNQKLTITSKYLSLLLSKVFKYGATVKTIPSNSCLCCRSDEITRRTE